MSTGPYVHRGPYAPDDHDPLFLDVDGDGEPTLWLGTPSDKAPIAVIRRCELDYRTRHLWPLLPAGRAVLSRDAVATVLHQLAADEIGYGEATDALLALARPEIEVKAEAIRQVAESAREDGLTEIPIGWLDEAAAAVTS